MVSYKEFHRRSIDSPDAFSVNASGFVFVKAAVLDVTIKSSYALTVNARVLKPFLLWTFLTDIGYLTINFY